MYYMGIDLHKKYFVSTIMDKEGKILKRSRVSTGITKQGNKWLRWALAEASHKAIVKSPSLRRYYNKIKYKKGSNTATIALSRKLLEIVYKVWKEQRPYYEKEICF